MAFLIFCEQRPTVHLGWRGAPLCWAMVALLLPIVSASAQRDPVLDSLRNAYRIALPEGFGNRMAFVRALPAINSSTPSGFGPQWGDVFMGGGYQYKTRSYTRGGELAAQDGAIVAGFGLGNAQTLGTEVAVTSFSTARSGLFSVTGVSLKVHRLFQNGWSVAAGSERALALSGEGDGERANYVVTSRVFSRSTGSSPLFRNVGVTLGVGDGRFRPLPDVIANRNTVGVFGAVASSLTEGVGAVADWNGQDLTLTASLVPFRCLPITINPGVTDVTRNNGTRPRFIVGAGLGLRANQLGSRLRACFPSAR